MRSLFRRFSLVAVAAVLACALLTTGCASRARVHYVPYDYFTWNSQEAIVYSQWERETNREHTDFTVLSNTDMHAYWKWRHRQPEQHRQTINDGLNSVHSGGK
jgi:hypothetical protein